jgi:hypothetical protein
MSLGCAGEGNGGGGRGARHEVETKQARRWEKEDLGSKLTTTTASVQVGVPQRRVHLDGGHGAAQGVWLRSSSVAGRAFDAQKGNEGGAGLEGRG